MSTQKLEPYLFQPDWEDWEERQRPARVCGLLWLIVVADYSIPPQLWWVLMVITAQPHTYAGRHGRTRSISTRRLH